MPRDRAVEVVTDRVAEQRRRRRPGCVRRLHAGSSSGGGPNLPLALEAGAVERDRVQRVDARALEAEAHLLAAARRARPGRRTRRRRRTASRSACPSWPRSAWSTGSVASLPRKASFMKKKARLPPAESPTGRPISTRNVAFGFVVGLLERRVALLAHDRDGGLERQRAGPWSGPWAWTPSSSWPLLCFLAGVAVAVAVGATAALASPPSRSGITICAIATPTPMKAIVAIRPTIRRAQRFAFRRGGSRFRLRSACTFRALESIPRGAWPNGRGASIGPRTQSAPVW